MTFLNKLLVCFWVLIGFLGLSFYSPVDSKEKFSRLTPIVIAAQKVSPSVVNIFTEEAPRKFKNPFRGFLNDSLVEEFFRGFNPPSSSGRRSLGSGVIINPKGYILTNEHVITKAVRIKVTLGDNREYDAKLIGADIKTDLAVIKIDSPKNLPYIKVGRSDDLMIGETVIAIGNPFGLKHTVTTGIISALDRTIQAGKDRVYNDFIQLDASINPGNSGGPLLNINGSLIGINTAIYQDAEGIGFAIPIDKAKRIVDDLIEFGKVRRGWVGVSVQNMTPNLAQHFGLDQVRGVVVNKVFRKSPASRVGIVRGDVLLKVDKHNLQNKSDYFEKIGSYPVNDSFRLEYLRNGRIRKAQLKVTLIPKEIAVEFARDWLGVNIKTINRNLSKQFRLVANNGVVVTKVIPQGACGKVGIQPGDVIRQVNQRTIQNEVEFNQAILEAGKRSSVVLLVQRGRYGYYVTLEP